MASLHSGRYNFARVGNHPGWIKPSQIDKKRQKAIRAVEKKLIDEKPARLNAWAHDHNITVPPQISYIEIKNDSNKGVQMWWQKDGQIVPAFGRGYAVAKTAAETGLEVDQHKNMMEPTTSVFLAPGRPDVTAFPPSTKIDVCIKYQLEANMNEGPSGDNAKTICREIHAPPKMEHTATALLSDIIGEGVLQPFGTKLHPYTPKEYQPTGEKSVSWPEYRTPAMEQYGQEYSAWLDPGAGRDRVEHLTRCANAYGPRKRLGKNDQGKKCRTPKFKLSERYTQDEYPIPGLFVFSCFMLAFFGLKKIHSLQKPVRGVYEPLMLT